MINDQSKMNDIVNQWATVRTLCSGSHRQAIVAPGVFMNETPPKGFRNLPLVLAYAILDEVLSALIDQQTFICKSWMLGNKMIASQTALPWQNYALVDAGKNARNALAHHATRIDDRQCLIFIEAIEVELKAWAVI